MLHISVWMLWSRGLISSGSSAGSGSGSWGCWCSVFFFATTLLDDPSIHNATRSNCALPDSASSDDSSFQAIIASVQCIALSSEAIITGVEEEFHQLSLETPCSSILEPTLSPISCSPTSNQQPTKSSSSRAEKSQHTQTALAQLSQHSFVCKWSHRHTFSWEDHWDKSTGQYLAWSACLDQPRLTSCKSS